MNEIICDEKKEGVIKEVEKKKKKMKIFSV